LFKLLRLDFIAVLRAPQKFAASSSSFPRFLPFFVFRAPALFSGAGGGPCNVMFTSCMGVR
jgi:hypothetical protein